MRKILLLAGLTMLVNFPSAYAMPEEAANDTVIADELLSDTETPAPLDDPQTFGKLFMAAVDVLNPQPEAIYRFEKDQWDAGVAGSLKNFLSRGYHLGRAKLGYGMSNYGYVGADVDLAGLYGRFAAGKLPQVDKVATIWSKYGTTGVHAGRDFEDQSGDYGFTVGVSVPWPGN